MLRFATSRCRGESRGASSVSMGFAGQRPKLAATEHLPSSSGVNHNSHYRTPYFLLVSLLSSSIVLLVLLFLLLCRYSLRVQSRWPANRLVGWPFWCALMRLDAIGAVRALGQ
ncbi:hypothetical protein V8C35DRAFT_54490 [Trichoderma chlorosporum]